MTLTIKPVVLMGLAALLLVSCSDFLEEQPQSFQTAESFYKTAADATAAVNGLYVGLRDAGYYGQRVWELSDINADQGRLLSTNGDNDLRELDNLVYSPTNTRFLAWWTAIYTNVNRTNSAIANLPRVPMDAALKARLLGEAKFLRALAYFDLVRAYGDVPLYDQPTTDLTQISKARDKAETVYQLIINDLKEAETALPWSYTAADAGRATRGAAKTLLAKVYLTRRDWANAAPKAKEVIDSKTYSLFPDYADLFRPVNKNGREQIFSVQYKVNEAGSTYTAHFTPLYVKLPLPGTVAGIGTFEVEPAFYRAMPNNYRKTVSMDSTYLDYRTNRTVGFYPVARKYLDPTMAGQFNSDLNWMVLRYADVLLMYAEALNEQSGPTADAYEAINQVRRRARAVGTPNAQPAAQYPDLQNLSQTAFRQAVEDERNWELCFEGHRRWDLLRTNRFIDVMKASGKNATAASLLFPLPQNELLKNPNLTQNP